jgi:hypothetical protein
MLLRELLLAGSRHLHARHRRSISSEKLKFFLLWSYQINYLLSCHQQILPLRGASVPSLRSSPNPVMDVHCHHIHGTLLTCNLPGTRTATSLSVVRSCSVKRSRCWRLPESRNENWRTWENDQHLIRSIILLLRLRLRYTAVRESEIHHHRLCIEV